MGTHTKTVIALVRMYYQDSWSAVRAGDRPAKTTVLSLNPRIGGLIQETVGTVSDTH